MSGAVLQKYCRCKEIKLPCCHEGWKLAFCSLKFCFLAESRYSPIEGQALAVG